MDEAVGRKLYVERCLAAAGIPVTALLVPSTRAAEEVLRRQEQGPLWRTAEEEWAADFAFAAALLHGSGASDAQRQQFAAGINNYFDRYQLVPGIRTLLNELRDAGTIQGVVSNWPPSLKAFLDHHDLRRYFSVVIGSGECGVAKPNPAIFLQALAALGVSPGDCIYVGDNRKQDIEPAEMLGMDVIHFDPRGRWQEAQCKDVSTLREHLLKRLPHRSRSS